ncbi:MAG: glycosyltransferase family 2 protein [Candidatus Omnitrophota bacterium]
MKKEYLHKPAVLKNPLMYQIIVFCWLLVVVYFNPRLFALLIGPENIFAKLAVILFTLLLDLFWFYAFFHLVTIAFSYFTNTISLNSLPAAVKKTDPLPGAALLYTTCDDFKEAAVLSCINQDYENYHTYILDDSRDPDFIRKIDNFVRLYSQSVSIIRRKNKQGYKAGNINNALGKLPDITYFSISDADTILPRDYIAKLRPYFNNPRIAFVQSKQVINPKQRSQFAQFLGYQISLHYEHYLKTKNKYGFVMFYGHGALMRRDVWQEIGGLPEIATEDLAYSMKIRAAGYAGVYAEEVTCLEEYPPTYRQYRRRNEKWIRGTTECLLKFYPAFASSKHISWIEKLDVFVCALSLLLGLPFVALLMLVGIILPFFFYHFRFCGPMIQMPVIYHKNLWLTVGLKSNLFWTWDFFILLLVTLLSPILPAMIGFFHHPVKRGKYILMYTFIFHAMQVVSAINLMSYLFSRSATFPVTGQKEVTDNSKGHAGGTRLWGNVKKFVSQPNANHHLIKAIEFVFAGIFIIIMLVTDNIWFLSFALGMLIGLINLKFGFEHKLIQNITLLPLIITLFIVLMIGRTLQ